jgi:hypothetical protein
MKLGLKDPTPGAIPLRFATYLNLRQLPSPPAEFGHYNLIPENSWGDLGNSDYGDCAIAGPCHQIELWTKEGPSKTAAPFTTEAALTNYSAVSGFSLADPKGTDTGCSTGEVADYWLKTGIVDAAGNRHKVVAVCDMNPGDLRELFLAIYLFQSVGMGFDFPESALEQTRNKQTWDVVPGATSAGGHYVPGFGCANSLGVGVSWGRQVAFTAAFYEKYNNQGVVALSEEMMVAAKSIDGFDDALLRDDITQLDLP